VSNTASTLTLYPVALSVLGLARAGLPAGSMRNFSHALLLGVAYAASIGGLATMIGTPRPPGIPTCLEPACWPRRCPSIPRPAGAAARPCRRDRAPEPPSPSRGPPGGARYVQKSLSWPPQQDDAPAVATSRDATGGTFLAG
jgi:hypothetical protein